MAANAMLTSPEEILRLRLELKKDPDYVTSSNWPSLVEWCSTCTSTRLVRLVLPEEEHEVKEAVVKEEVEEETKVDFNMGEEKASCCEATAQDACTQTPRRRRRGGHRRRRRRGGRHRRAAEAVLRRPHPRHRPLNPAWAPPPHPQPRPQPLPPSPRHRSYAATVDAAPLAAANSSARALSRAIM